MPETGPADPMTALASGAAAFHELFTSYVEAGFSRAEALQIVISILIDGVSKMPPPQ